MQMNGSRMQQYHENFEILDSFRDFNLQNISAVLTFLCRPTKDPLLMTMIHTFNVCTHGGEP